MAINMGSAIAYLELDTSKFSKGFTSAYNDLKVFGDKSSTAEQKFKGFSSALNTVGSVLAKSVTLPIAGVGVAALKAGTDFESAMSQVAATMGKPKSEIQNLTDFAEKMGATTVFSAKQAAEGLNILAQSGLDANDQMKVLPEVLNLAAAGNLSLADSATYVVGTLKGFGQSMDNAQRVTDLVAKGATMANTDVRGLGTALSSSSATAKSYGQNMDSVTLSLLRLAEQNITGEEAATALNRAMMDLYTPTTNAKKALDELGISAYDSSGKARDFNDIIDDLNGALSGMSEEQQNAYKNTIFTTYGLQAFNKMTVASTEKVNEFKKGLQDATGSAAQQAQTQLDNLKGDITLFKSALEGTGIVISNIIIPKIREFVKFLTNLLTKFNDMNPATQKLIVNLGLIAAAVGPIMLIFSKLFGTLSKITSVTKIVSSSLGTVLSAGLNNAALSAAGASSNMITLSSVLSAITSPIALIVAGFAALAGAFITLWNTSEDFRNNITGTFKNLQQVVQNFLNGIVSRINELGFNFTSITDAIKSAWIGLCNIIAPIFSGAFKTVVDILSNVFDTILSALDVFIGVFTGDWQRVKDGLTGIFDSIVELALGFVTNIIAIFGEIGANILEAFGLDGVADKFREFFTDTIPSIIDSAIGAIEGAFEGIITFFTETLPNGLNNFANVTVPQFISNVTAFFQNLPYNIGYIIGEAIGHIYLFGSNLLSWAATAIPQFISNVVSFFVQLPGAIWQWLVSAFNYVVTWGSQTVSQGRSAMQNFITAVLSIIRNLPSNIWSILTQIPSKVRQMGSDLRSAGSAAFNALWDGIKSVGESIIGWVSDFASTITSFVSGIVDGFKNIVSGADDAKSAAASVKGRHANGLDYVPYNGYIAELHKGERVLTAQENKAYSKGINASSTGGDTFNFYNTKPEPYEYSRQMKRARKELLQGI
nr:MAG TPA: minor tail protein [Caudoviricetes sp.]